jgi:hypothetical protein
MTPGEKRLAQYPNAARISRAAATSRRPGPTILSLGCIGGTSALSRINLRLRIMIAIS